MADANHIRQIYERYPEMVTKGDVEGIVELYSDDATIEDPIGSELRRGRDAIRAFYESAAGAVTMKCTGPAWATEFFCLDGARFAPPRPPPGSGGTTSAPL